MANPPPPPRRPAKPPPPPHQVGRNALPKKPSKPPAWMLPVLVSAVAVFLLLVILLWLGIWAAVSETSVATSSGSKSSPAVHASSTAANEAQQATAHHTQDASGAAPAEQPRRSESTSVPKEPASPTPRSAGDTGAMHGPLEPTSANAVQDEDKPSVLGGSFFGIQAEGQRFVYVVDCSGSMDGRPYERAAQELVRSLAALSRSQEFFVVLYSDASYPMYYPDNSQKFVKATDDAIGRIQSWMLGFRYRGGTNPDSALQLALKMKPDAVFFLTDGEIPDSTADLVRQANTGMVPIHTLCFTTRAGETTLKRIAKENHGKYLFVP